MHFAILLCHASMHSWKDLSRIARSFFVIAILMASTSGKHVLFMTQTLSLGNRKKSQGARSGEYGGCSSTAMLFWQEIPRCSMQCVPEHCRGEAPSFFHTFVTFSLELTESDVAGHPCKWAGWWSGSVARILRAQCPSHQRKKSTSPWFWSWPSSLFFGLGNIRLFHWRLWCLVFVSYSKIHDSPPVITLYSKFGSSCFRMSWHACTCHSFCSSFSNFGTIFAQIFRNDCPHPLTVHVQLICNHSNSQVAISNSFLQTSSTFSVVLLVADLLLLESSSTSSLTSLNLLCHSKARALDVVSSPYTSCSNLYASVVVFPSWTRNFKLVCCSVVILLQQKLSAFFSMINARLTPNKSLQKSVLLTQKYETAVVDPWEVDLHCVAIGKAQATCAQSFPLWQQATIDITRQDKSIIACSCHIYVLFFAHIPFVVNHTFNATSTEVATTSLPFYNELHQSHALFVKASHSTTFTSWSQHHFVVIGKLEQHMRKASHCGSKQQ